MEDEAIVGLFFDRSEEAIERLNEKYGRVILSIGKNILGNEPDAEECANDAYLAVWNSIPPERPLCLSAYVCKIARNIALKRYRYRKAEKRSARFDVSLEELEGILQDTEGVEERVERDELIRALNEWLGKLGGEDLYIFMRRYWYYDSVREISRQTRKREAAVYRRLTKLKAELRAYLLTRGIEA